MSCFIPNKSKLDYFNEIFPDTFRQFENVLCGELNYNRKTEEVFTQEEAKSYCMKKFFSHITFLPLTLPGRILFNGGKTLFKVVDFALTAFNSLKNNQYKKQNQVVNKSWEVLDSTLATILSPFQSIGETIRLGLAAFSPETYLQPIEALPLTTQLELLSVKLCDLFKMFKEDEKQSSEYYTDLRILKACYHYSRRYNLISTHKKRFSRSDQQERTYSLKGDDIQDKYQLCHQFQTILENWHSAETENQLIFLEDFFINSFKTEDQVTIMNDFFSKNWEKVYDHGWLSHDPFEGKKESKEFFQNRYAELKNFWEQNNQTI